MLRRRRTASKLRDGLKLRIRRFTLVLVLAAAAGGCQQGPPNAGPGKGADEGTGLTVVGSVFPLAWIGQSVAPSADVLQLGQRGVEPHDLEVTPRERAALSVAEVVVYVGPVGFQPQVERAVEDAEGEVVSVVDTVGSDRLLAAGGDGVEDAEEVADDESVDPHVWFDPRIMADVAVEIGDAFATVQPENAAAFRSRARAVREELLTLADEVDELLTGCRLREALVSHEAYAYLLNPRGLDQLGIAGNAPEAGASPARLAEVTDEVRRRGIRAVLAEPLEGRSDAEALAREAGIDLLEIDPLEVVSPGDQPRGYPALLRQQAERFAEALEC